MSKGTSLGSRRSLRFAAIPAACVLVAAACGSDDDGESSETTAESETTAAPETTAGSETTAPETTAEPADDATGQASGEVPTIAVTTSVLGDVVSNLVCESAEVVTLMPVGADPHDFQMSAQEANELRSADVIIVNGLNFEEGIISAIESAESDGVMTYEAITGVSTIEFGEGGHSHGDDEHDHGDDDHDHGDDEHDHGDEEHSDDEHDHGDEEHSDDDHDHGDEEHSDDDHDHGDDHDHDHSGDDPHFFTDSGRMIVAAEGITAMLADVPGIDTAALEECSQAYLDELAEVDAEVAATVEAIPAEQRILVTNHDAFGYFADRYGFEVVGTIIPGGSTTDGASAGGLAELAETIQSEGVPAIFADNTVSTQLAETLAAEVGGDVEVIELYSGSLGEDGSDGATYVDYVRANAERIAAGLT